MQREDEGVHDPRVIVVANFFPHLRRQVFDHAPPVSSQIFDATGTQFIDPRDIHGPADCSADGARHRTAGAMFSVTLLNIIRSDVERFVRHALYSLAAIMPRYPMRIRRRHARSLESSQEG